MKFQFKIGDAVTTDYYPDGHKLPGTVIAIKKFSAAQRGVLITTVDEK